MIDEELFNEFVEMRSENKPLTNRAKKRMRNKLERLEKLGHDPYLLLENAIINNWQDVYPNDSTTKKLDPVEELYSEGFEIAPQHTSVLGDPESAISEGVSDDGQARQSGGMGEEFSGSDARTDEERHTKVTKLF